MKFGPVAVAKARGAILAHSLTAGGLVLKKGRRLSGSDLTTLHEAGIFEVTVAQLESGDIGEDDAAQRLAECLRGTGLSVSAPFTGRANIHAEVAGVLSIDAQAIAALNDVDEALTLATLPNMARVAARQIVATVKVIPYAVAETAVTVGEARLSGDVLRLHAFKHKRADLILTRTEGFREKLLKKAQSAVRDRLTALGVDLINVQTVAHDETAVAQAIQQTTEELVLIFGASATSDRHDVCPEGMVKAGGNLVRFGMPVDPGNLLFLGDLEGRSVIGLPGCARSPALNGADWVLERVVAGLEVTSADVAAMGVGGLLKEIPTRPRPRDTLPIVAGRPRVEVVLLAAGASCRMGDKDKLTELVDGEPLLRVSARAMLTSQADKVHVVLPKGNPEREATLEGLALTKITAFDSQLGMAASLRAGLRAVGEEADAVIIALADMPDVLPEHIDRLIAAFDVEENREIARAMDEDGQPGHPVLFARRFFESLALLEGDEGAKAIIREAKEYVVEVPTKGLGATTDLDTPQDWAEWRARRKDVA